MERGGLGYSIRLKPFAMRYDRMKDRVYNLNKVTYDNYFKHVDIGKTCQLVVEAFEETIKVFPPEIVDYFTSRTLEQELIHASHIKLLESGNIEIEQTWHSTPSLPYSHDSRMRAFTRSENGGSFTEIQRYGWKSRR